MNRPNLKSMATSQLIEQFVARLLQQYTVRDHCDAQGMRDVRPWNQLADKIHAIHRELKSRGDEGVDAILPLIHHPNPNVRQVASVACLRQRTAQVIPALEDAAQNNNWFETKVDPAGSLERWREGKWIVD
jgi:hypothetical protein